MGAVGLFGLGSLSALVFKWETSEGRESGPDGPLVFSKTGWQCKGMKGIAQNGMWVPSLGGWVWKLDWA